MTRRMGTNLYYRMFCEFLPIMAKYKKSFGTKMIIIFMNSGTEVAMWTNLDVEAMVLMVPLTRG